MSLNVAKQYQDIHQSVRAKRNEKNATLAYKACSFTHSTYTHETITLDIKELNICFEILVLPLARYFS